MTKSAEEYLKVIYLLSKKNSKIRVTDIAKEMNYTKPSVTKQLNILKNDEMIEYNAYSNIVLTSKGIEKAKKIVEANNILYMFMHDILMLEDKEALLEAKKIKSVMSDESLNKLASFVYKELGLKEKTCDFDITSDKCRLCFMALRKMREENETIRS